MKKWILALALISNYAFVAAQNLAYDWVERLESGSNQAIIFQITNDADGNVIVGGYFTDSLIYGSNTHVGTPNVRSPFIAKYNATGTLQWLNHYTPVSNCSFCGFSGIKTDSQNNIIAVGTHSGGIDFGDGSGVLSGSTSGTSAFIVKLSPSGQALWVKNYNSNTFLSDDVSIQNDEIYCLMRYTGSAVDMDLSANVSMVPFPNFNPNPRAIVLKLDENGDFLWATGFNSLSNNIFKLAKMATNEDFTYIAGDYYHYLAVDSTVITVGTPSFKVPAPANHSAQIFVAKLNNTNGVVSKVIGIGGYDDESVIDLKMDSNNDLYLLGKSNYTLDVDPSSDTTDIVIPNERFLAKYSEDLNYISAIPLPYQYTQEIEVDSEGKLYLGGFCIICAGEITTPGAFVYIMNQNYVYQSHYQLSNVSYAYALEIAADKVYLGGNFSIAIDFDMSSNNSILTPTLGSDAFILSLNIVPSTASLSENNLETFHIYPNPASTSVTLSNLPIDSDLKIVDITGKVISAITVTSTNMEVPIDFLSNGIYFIQIEQEGAIAQKKLVVNK